MINILSIETSTSMCSVALSSGINIVAEEMNNGGQNHASYLPVFLQKIITFADRENINIDAVAVSEGPGSYTGLRIGVSSAKGISYGRNIPLISVDTLQLIAIEAKKRIDFDTLFCPMIDARRMEVYSAIFGFDTVRQTQTEAVVVDENAFMDVLADNTVVFCGDGANKCKDIIASKNAFFLEEIHPFSRNMANVALEKYKNKCFENVAYFEPFYLKEFRATQSLKKII